MNLIKLKTLSDITRIIDPIIKYFHKPSKIKKAKNSIIYYFSNIEELELKLHFYILGENLNYSYHICLGDESFQAKNSSALVENSLPIILYNFIEESTSKYKKLLKTHNNHNTINRQ